MAEGWWTGSAALAQSLVGEGEIALLGQLHQQRVVGQVGLDDHLAGLFGPSSTTGDLHDQLGHALAGAKIRGKQPAIGVEDGYQGHAREVMPLGEHLRAHQQAGFATIDNPQELLHRAFARSAVAVDAQDREIWKENAQTLFGSLGTGPTGRRSTRLHSGQLSGGRSAWPQW